MTTAQPTSSARSSTANRSPKRIWRIVGLVSLSIIGLAFALLASVVVFGRIQGEEFSAANFQRREFLYYEIPLAGLQVWPIDRTSTTNQLERWLTSNRYVSVANANTEAKTEGQPKTGGQPKTRGGAGAEDKSSDDVETRGATKETNPNPDRNPDNEPPWDLVVARRGATLSQIGDAKILCQYLDAESDGGEFFWLEWTKEHKDLGKITWPLVARLARQKMYIFVPAVLDSARRASDADKFEREMVRMLGDRFHELAMSQQQQQRHQVALDLIQDGLAYGPDHAGLLAAQKASQAALNADPSR